MKGIDMFHDVISTEEELRSLLGETLRINGRACVIRDQSYLAQLEVGGRRPELGIAVEVEECFIHCAKAFIRAGLWQQETWLEKEELLSAAHILADHVKLPGVGAKEVAESLQESYTKRLYWNGDITESRGNHYCVNRK